MASSWNTTPIAVGMSPVSSALGHDAALRSAGQPASRSSSVDLPQPDGPTTAKNSRA